MHKKTRRLSARNKWRTNIELLEQRHLLSGSAPVAVDDVFTLAPNHSLTANVLTNDRDAEHDPLSASLLVGTGRGQLTFNANGSFTYTPMFGFNGVDQFTYLATDGTSNSKLGYVAIQVGYTPKTSSITGTIFGDSNDNGSHNTGEPGLAARTVFIDSNNDGVLDAGETTTTANSSGVYKFTGLAAGAYRVAQVVPSGNTQTEPGKGTEWVIQLGSSQAITARDFGIYKPSTIAGTVFNDLNNNGVHDINEPLLQGWRIFIDTNQNGRLDGNELSTRSDANGAFSFVNLPAGNYPLRETVVGGWQGTTPPGQTVKLSLGATTSSRFGDITQSNFATLTSTPPPKTLFSNGAGNSTVGSVGSSVLDTGDTKKVL